ncbi:MAG TPA: carbonic anhydrase [Thermomonospora sp.]|nr:carbonic anhydrase [Thermomonospora sp.]
MRTFIEHARSFPARAAAQGERLDRHAAGQSPFALFVTCSDSRVVPSLITGARPGELFELRTAGGIVPAYSLDRPTGEAATIEFAVRGQGVADIIVCGHSQCAAVNALVQGDDLPAVPAMGRWLSQAAEPPAAENGDLSHAIQRHVLAQLDRLRAYPAVRERLDEGRLGLHGWFYEVHTGRVLAHRSSDDTFPPL